LAGKLRAGNHLSLRGEPSGTVRDGVGRHGSMKPVGKAGERVSIERGHIALPL
jgi:hypothetical protein